MQAVEEKGGPTPVVRASWLPAFGVLIFDQGFDGGNLVAYEKGQQVA